MPCRSPAPLGLQGNPPLPLVSKETPPSVPPVSRETPPNPSSPAPLGLKGNPPWSPRRRPPQSPQVSRETPPPPRSLRKCPPRSPAPLGLPGNTPHNSPTSPGRCPPSVSRETPPPTPQPHSYPPPAGPAIPQSRPRGGQRARPGPTALTGGRSALLCSAPLRTGQAGSGRAEPQQNFIGRRRRDKSTASGRGRARTRMCARAATRMRWGPRQGAGPSLPSPPSVRS